MLIASNCGLLFPLAKSVSLVYFPNSYLIDIKRLIVNKIL